MSGEVLAQGDDEPGRGPGRAVGAVVALAVLAIAGTALTRGGDDPPGRATPSPSATAGGLPGRPGDPAPAGPARDDPFRNAVTVALPPPGVLRAVLLPDGVPGFLVPDEELPTPLAAVGGPDHAPVLVGWCAATRRFIAADNSAQYDDHGNNLLTGPGLARHAVRRNTGGPLRIDVGGQVERRVNDATRPSPPRQPCPEPLFFPDLPRRAERVHDTARGHRLLTGRYVVTTETRAFCALGGGPRCAANGWEVYRIGSLPLSDPAGAYTWEGRFLVRGALDGSLSVIRLPGTRLTRRERVGAAVLVGLPHGVARTGSGPYRLLFNPFRHVTGHPDDRDTKPGAAQFAPEWDQLMLDVGGNVYEYAVRPDVEVVLGLGVTGPGRAQATVRTLERFLESPDNLRQALWVVLDARGRVLRVVAQPRP